MSKNHYSGFDNPQEALKWFKAGWKEEENPHEWYDAGWYNPEEARKWFLAGWEDPEMAYEWYDAGWKDPGEALLWFNAGIDNAVSALEYQDEGWEIDEAAKGYRAGFPNGLEATDWKRETGLDPETANRWADVFEGDLSNALLYIEAGWKDSKLAYKHWENFKSKMTYSKELWDIYMGDNTVEYLRKELEKINNEI